MPKEYQVNTFVRASNSVMSFLLHRGLKIGDNALITIVGRKSGVPRTNPVTVLEHDGERLVQSPFGDVNWVRNLRASGKATLKQGRHEETISVVELSHDEAARMYKDSIAKFPGYVKGYFDVRADSPIEDFVKEAPHHPVFRIVSTQ